MRRGLGVRWGSMLLGGLAIVLAGSWLALGTPGLDSTGEEVPPVKPASTGHPFPLALDQALARDNVDGVDYIVAPKANPEFPDQLCLSVLVNDGNWLFGCSPAEQVKREGMAFSEAGPAGTRIWAYSPILADSVSAGGVVVARPGSHFFSAAIPSDIATVSVTGPDGTRPLRVKAPTS